MMASTVRRAVDPEEPALAVPASNLQRSTEERFDSTHPATGERVGTFPVHDAESVQQAVERARGAAAWWESLGFRDRARRLHHFKGILARRADELCEVIHRETGKPLDGAFIEVLLCVEHLDWAIRNAPKVLGRRRVRSTLNLINVGATLEYRPYGVVGVIGPWNYPLHTPMGSISYALAAGNAVVFKPSELTPAVATWVAEAFAEAVPEQPVLQVVTGFGETGHALVAAGVDKVAFTGSAATGRKVMAAAAESLTPVLMECGGKDALIVDVDADLDAAANGAVWGGISNTGQTCAGVERVYVPETIYEPFLARVVELTKEVTVGEGPHCHIGAMTMERQVDIVREHLTDALERGGRAVVGGPESIRPPFIDPVVLVDVPEEARIMREETFGPILPITKVRDVDEAIERANDSHYALGAAVYAKKRAREIADRLQTGMVSTNGVLVYAAIPGLPFGGQGESGFGRIHGEDGLREFGVAKAVTNERFALPFDAWSFRKPEWLFPVLGKGMKLRFGRHGK
jgi:succinate-semialdehyde dehydrogenase / glutarate-semialdehyde dehydrogenase